MQGNIAEVAAQYGDVQGAKRALRNVQSKKCRLKKRKSISEKDYTEQMNAILKQEAELKDVVAYFVPKKVFVTEMTIDDVEKLGYEETLKAIKSIQSKKCNTDYTVEPDEYKKALDIETMLINHREAIKPCGKDAIKKTKLQSVCDQLKKQDQMVDRDKVVAMLESLLNGEEA